MVQCSRVCGEASSISVLQVSFSHRMAVPSWSDKGNMSQRETPDSQSPVSGRKWTAVFTQLKAVLPEVTDNPLHTHQPGDWVLIKDFRRKRWSQPRWRGPFQVLLTTQNRMALDMLLAKEGGVCSMIGDHCCTYIPPSDAPGGNISMALDHMSKIADQLRAEEAGVRPWDWKRGSLFSMWKSIVIMILPSILLLALIICCGPLLCQCMLSTIRMNMDTRYQLIQVTKEDLDEDNTLYLHTVFSDN
ncbi:uncharacterized protein LOC118241879 [Electrophorus electricus]|uniref:uncharacterized protein LOC118241879 n=1 Tax=Electrophorus electricus TaxID=8005 RepID=UPI0015D07501|nr:uncharacterized protein LOC118241879 [Electrophorus electricus]